MSLRSVQQFGAVVRKPLAKSRLCVFLKLVLHSDILVSVVLRPFSLGGGSSMWLTELKHLLLNRAKVNTQLNTFVQISNCQRGFPSLTARASSPLWWWQAGTLTSIAQKALCGFLWPCCDVLAHVPLTSSVLHFGKRSSCSEDSPHTL